MDAGDIFATDEAAKYLGYHPEHVRRLARQGKLVPDKRIGTSLLFTRETLDAWKAARKEGQSPGQTGA